jgi:hypothetical protein
MWHFLRLPMLRLGAFSLVAPFAPFSAQPHLQARHGGRSNPDKPPEWH